jgi:hypothetical protein
LDAAVVDVAELPLWRVRLARLRRVRLLLEMGPLRRLLKDFAT